MAVLLVLFIVGSGYLLIYNVFSLSISKDARFYGLLRTIGTTQRQIERLVKRQAAKLAIIGISIGIVLATAVSFAIVPLVLDRAFEAGRSMMDAEVFFHPSIYVLSILFSAATVAIACSAPPGPLRESPLSRRCITDDPLQALRGNARGRKEAACFSAWRYPMFSATKNGPCSFSPRCSWESRWLSA